MAEKGSNDGPISGSKIKKIVSPSFIRADRRVDFRVPPVLSICEGEFLGIAGSTGIHTRAVWVKLFGGTDFQRGALFDKTFLLPVKTGTHGMNFGSCIRHLISL